MAIKTANSLFFTNNKASMDDHHRSMDCQPLIKSIAWFAQMARNENITADEIEAVLAALAEFFDEKAAEQAEIVAEMQLAEAFKEVLQERRAELIESVKLKR